MFSHKPISVLGILTVILILLICSPWSAMAQFSEQRLIPVAVEDVRMYDDGPSECPCFDEPHLVNAIAQTLPAHGFAVYGRAPEGYPETATTLPDNYIGRGMDSLPVRIRGNGSAEVRYLSPTSLTGISRTHCYDEPQFNDGCLT